MMKSTSVAVAFASVLACTAPGLAQGDETASLSDLFTRFADAASLRGEKVCLPAPTTNAAPVLQFKSLQGSGKHEPTALMMSAAFTKAGEFAICASPVVAAGGADAYVFLGTVTTQERTILLNPSQTPLKQEEALLAAIEKSRALFAENNKDQLSDADLAVPRALTLRRNWLGHVTDASLTPLPPEQLKALPGVFSQVEHYLLPKPAAPAELMVPVSPPPSEEKPAVPTQTTPETAPPPAAPAPVPEPAPIPVPAPEPEQVIVQIPQKPVPPLSL